MVSRQELPGERARRWCYALVSVALAVCLVASMVSDFPGWLTALGVLGGVLAAMAAKGQQYIEQAALEPPAPCTTPGCTCGPPVMDYCAGCGRVDVETRFMAWTNAGLWRCLGCTGTDVAPRTEVAKLMAAADHGDVVWWS